MAPEPIPAAVRRGIRGRGCTPPRESRASESHRGADAEAFYRVRGEIALDSTAPTGDRLRAIEQIESRALGKPKETVTTEVDESEAIRELRELTPEQRPELLHRWNDPDGGVEAVEASG